jgi:hypothetical protein
MRIHIEYSPEGGGDPKAIEFYSIGQTRELTYEAMDEVLKAHVSETELTAITCLLDNMDVTQEHVPSRLADRITLSYESSAGEVHIFWGEMGSRQFVALLEAWIALERLGRRYFRPRFY